MCAVRSVAECIYAGCHAAEGAQQKGYALRQTAIIALALMKSSDAAKFCEEVYVIISLYGFSQFTTGSLFSNYGNLY